MGRGRIGGGISLSRSNSGVLTMSDDRPFYIPIFEVAGVAALVALLRRLDKATGDVLKLSKAVRVLFLWVVGLSILTLLQAGTLLWLILR